MRTIFLTGFSILLLLKLSGQNDCGIDEDRLIKSFEEKLVGIIIIKPLDGRQFYTHDFRKTNITLNNRKIITNELIKYNGDLDQFIWLNTVKNRQVLLNNELMCKVTFMPDESESAKCFKRMKIKQWYNTDSVYVWLEVLTEGTISLYALRKIDYYPNTDEYRMLYKYYIELDNGLRHAVRLTRKHFLSMLAEHDNSFRAVMHKEHLRFRQEEDLIKVLQLYNKKLVETGR